MLKILCENISRNFFLRKSHAMKNVYAKFFTLYFGSGRLSRGLKYCLINIAETLADSLACSRSIKIASVQDRVTTVHTYSLHTSS